MNHGLRYAAVLCGLLTLLLLRPAHAQNTMTAVPDTAQGRPVAERKQPTAADSARLTERLLGMRLTRPAKAGWLSLILPGAGQIYNHRYWKLPLVYGGIGAVTAAEFFYQNRYKEYTRGYVFWLRDGNGSNDPGPNSSQASSTAVVYNNIVFYRRNRDTFLAYTALVYGITILDAIVDAHLRDFDVSDDLSVQWAPTLLPTPYALPAPGLAVTISLTSKRSLK